MSDIVSGERVRWLTYVEAGQLLGAKDDSIRRRAMRSGWKRQQGNDGRALVAVPLDVLGDVVGGQSAPDKKANIRGDVTADKVSSLREALARQEATIEGLQALVARLEADRQAMAAEVTVARQEAHEARQTAAQQAVGLAEVRERAGRAEGEAEGLRAALRASEAQAATLQADVVRERATALAGLQAEAAERQAAETAREELAAWRQGGPLTRALRAFFRQG